MHLNASTRPRKRFFLSRWIRRFIKRIMTEDTSVLPAVNWQRTMQACILCHATLRKETSFCPYCGTSQQHTERLQTVEQQETLTNRLNNIRRPGERPMDTYNRLTGKKV